MPEFIEVIPVATERHYFSFRKNETASGVIFFIVTLEGNKAVSFEMKEQEKGVWKITTSAPEWIKRIEAKLSEAIRIRQDLRI